MASDNITRTLMYKDIPICEVIFKNGYFYKIKKILNQDLLPTKYFNCNTALALARWFSIRDLCYLRTEFTHNKSAEEFDLISNNWMFASPFDNYWLSSPDNNYNWHMVNNLPLNVLSFNLPKNAFYYKITDNNIIYREPYSANNVSARKFTTYTSKTIIDKTPNVVIKYNNRKFLSGIISNMIGVPSDTSVSEIIVFIANGLTGICMNVIAFGMIFVGSLIVLLILNILVNILRNVNFIKVIDGILGAVLSLVIYLAIVAGLFALLRVFMGQDWFTIKDWFITDMHLTDDAFRISKALYQNNIFINIISIFGPIK